MHGALLTLRLSVQTMVCGMALGMAGAVGQMYGGRALRAGISTWIEICRNTPLLIQLFLIYFGLPQFGVRLSADLAALLGLSLYLGAFATEIIRAGLESIPKSQVEAGYALGLRTMQVFRHIILVPGLRAIAPSLAGQFIIIILTTSVVSTISADELASTVNGLQTSTFRPFEFYLTASAIYLGMALGIRGVLTLAVARFLPAGAAR